MATNVPATANAGEGNAAARAIATTNLDGNAPRAMFLPATMGEAMELARLMAGSNFVPPHLRGKPGDCLAVVMQANRWAMDPFAVGSKTYFVSDKIGYEAQLVNAVINASGALDGRLHHEWEGKDNELVCTVTGKIKGDDRVKTRRVAIKTITTRNSPLWKQDPEQQLAYYASRAWVRLNAPEVLMGIYTPDELRQNAGTAGAATDVKDGGRLSAAALIEQANAEPRDPVTGEVETGRADTDHGDQHDGTDDDHPARAIADAIILRCQRAEVIGDVIVAEGDFAAHRDAAPDGIVAEVARAVETAKVRIKGENA